MATPAPQGNAVRLASASAFTGLPRPDHDEVTGGIRHGSERVPATVGAFLLVVAPFGAWTRVTEVTAPGEEARVAGEVLGIDLAAGAMLLVAAVAAVVATIGFGRRRGIHRVAVVAGLVAVVLPVARLVELAAVLSLQPRLLLLDEPASGIAHGTPAEVTADDRVLASYLGRTRRDAHAAG